MWCNEWLYDPGTPSRVVLALPQVERALPCPKTTNRQSRPQKQGESPSHTMWMCEQGIEFAGKGDIEKAMRWLGFVQGMLFYTGHYTIDEMRAHSASPTEP